MWSAPDIRQAAFSNSTGCNSTGALSKTAPVRYGPVLKKKTPPMQPVQDRPLWGELVILMEEGSTGTGVVAFFRRTGHRHGVRGALRGALLPAWVPPHSP